MTISRRFSAIAVVAVIACVAILIKREPASSSRGIDNARSQKQPAANEASATAAKQVPIPSTSGDPLSSWTWGESRQRQLEAMLATHDPAKWKPVLGDLLNPHFKRVDAIAVLERLLDYPDPNVRMTAAAQLLELGSYLGVPVLQAVLRLAARGELSGEFAEYAGDSLHRYRQIIDPQDLYQAYTRFKSPFLAELATMQQVPQMRDLVLQWRETNQSGYDKDRMAAYLGMKDADSITRYQRMVSSNDVRSQLLGHWALFQALGQQSSLDKIVSTARQVAGVEPTSEEDRPLKRSREIVFDFLAITVDPRTTKTLEEIADFVAVQSGGDSHIFSRAFGALFYLHKDDAFVNKRVLEYLLGKYGGPGVDRGLMMRIAAARRTPTMDAAAQAHNAMAYEYALHSVTDRPVESWGADLRRVPITVIPPLPVVNKNDKSTNRR